MLLAKGADVNQRNMDDHTSLAEASWKGHAQVVKMLLAKGADPNLPDYEGVAALYLG
jgi:ankyrin repeat protein